MVNVFKGTKLKEGNILEAQELPILNKVNPKGVKIHKINNEKLNNFRDNIYLLINF